MAMDWTEIGAQPLRFGERAGEGLSLFVSALLPLAGFVAMQLAAEDMGVARASFGPQGLPAWMMLAATVTLLPMWGLAHWLVSQRGAEGIAAARWIALLIGAVIVVPYGMAAVDGFFASMLAMLVLLIGIVAAGRAALISGPAALLLLPGLFWAGGGALLGFSSIMAGWSPPFALIDHNKH